MKRPVKIIVVGGNAAGPAAAARAKRYNPNAEVLLFEASEFISTGTCEMPYVLSGEIDDYRKIIFFSPSSFQKEKGVKVFVKNFVQEIDAKKKMIIIKDLIEDKIFEHDYDRLILATGSKAKTLPGFDTQLKNIFTLKNINDLIRLDEFIKENKVTKSIIIGSGYIGLEAGEALVKRNIQVKIIERESKPLPGADKEFSDEILKILNQNKVEFIGDVKEVEPVISGDKLVAVRIGDKFLETDFVLLSVGFEPDTFLAQSAKLELGKSGAIEVDQYLKTSDRFIYAAGDNGEIINAVTGKPDYVPLATQAYDLGHIAGENAAGGNVKYDPIVKNISVKIFDKFFASIGLSSSEARQNGFEFEESFTKASNLVGVMPGSDYVIGKVLADKNSKRIIGASFLGGKEVSGYADLLSALIKLRAPSSTLSQINYNYTPPLSPFIHLLTIIGKNFNK
ncbi:MAG TPA: FAD-dependent oxidoreductase [Ignavibacteriaceae bacterium]|nr:FAD-dependent oxidoreductase [Ignavibacteriaceae bacterium]